jgi:glucokinase
MIMGMHPENLVMAMIIGGVFIVLGLVPRLLAGLQDAIQKFSASLRSHYRINARHQTAYENLPRQPWLVALGVVAILLSLFAYIAR